MVVLHEVVEQPRLFKLPFGVALHKETPVIAEHLGFYNDHTVNFCLDKIHDAPQ